VSRFYRDELEENACIIGSRIGIVTMASTATQAAVGKLRGLGRADRPEFRLVLACCSEQWNSQTRAQFSHPPSAEINWPLFLEIIEKHGLLPLAQRNLVSAENLIPNEISSEVQKRFAEHVRRALALTQLLYKITRALEEAGIPALPYKGPVLAHRLYGDVAMRQYSDLDCLVSTQNVIPAKAALAKLGFLPHGNLRPAEEKALLSSGYELTFDGLGNRNVVEIQWRVVPRFYCVEMDAKEFFPRVQTVEIDGTPLQTLRDEDLVLTLSTHAAKHAWMKLSWTFDIARFSSVPGIGWSGVRERATTLGIERIIGISFFLAREFLGAVLPPEIESLIAGDRQVAILGNQIAEKIVHEGELDPESIAYFRLMLKIRERLRDRFRFVWRLLITPTESEWSLIRLPGWLFPLYHVVRISRLVGRLLRFGATLPPLRD
jgi:putative nucleotidyltransferase-like protein